MFISAPTLDDLLHIVLSKLLRTKNYSSPTRGPVSELTGILLKLSNPRARLSRTEGRGLLFSCLGELLWYLAKTDDLDFIAYYVPKYRLDSEDGRTLHGAYGPRLFRRENINQIDNVISLLRRKPDSRRAVVQLFDASDIAQHHKEIPCTCTLQFMIRRGRLHMFTSMRSNDAFLGLPHDVFAFTMIQEILARDLGVELGEYKQAVGNLHLYEVDRKRAQKLVDEGWQRTDLAMPPMPNGQPWSSIERILEVEKIIRQGMWFDFENLALDDYWKDMVRLLRIYRKYKDKDWSEIVRLKTGMCNSLYRTYIEKKEQRPKQSI